MPTSTEIQARVRVLLYPEQDSTQPWPCPPGVSIQLKKKGVGSAKLPPRTLRTGMGGVASARLETGTHQVNITDPKFQLWTSPDLNVPAPEEKVVAVGLAEEETGEEVVAIVAEAEELLDIPLFPQGDRRLVVVRLVNEDGDYLTDGTMNIAAPGGPTETFTACDDNNIYAAAPEGAVTFVFPTVTLHGQPYCTQSHAVPYTVSPNVPEVKPLEFIYWPAIQIVANPTVVESDGKTVVPLTGTSVTVEYRVSPEYAAASRTKKLGQEADASAVGGTISFESAFPGEYMVTVSPPNVWNHLPIQATNPALVTAQTLRTGTWTTLSAGSPWEVPAAFAVVPTQVSTIQLELPAGEQLTKPAQFEVSYDTGSTTGSVPVTIAAEASQAPVTVPADASLTIEPAPGAVLRSTSGTLKMATSSQAVTSGTTTNVRLIADHSIRIRAVDEGDQPAPRTMIDIFGPGDATKLYRTVITDEWGVSVVMVGSAGIYYLSEHFEGGHAGIRQAVDVASEKDVLLRIRNGPGGGEALTDLSAYPVLTEEISTTGVPAPTAGAPGGGGPGAGYGQTVDQVMRDVLGWRPSGDVAGFQAALTGAFQLRQVEGHTDWTWQQRGYAVQADMGALTGAQASIYARAKAALDQIQPLLAGVTALNPNIFPPEDLEAIRSVIAAEIQELVNELALEGGPRIQRVDQLFKLLVGESRKSFDPNPDHVQGQLGTMRARFGLTEEWVDTIDEERILTNFRVVVEQVMSLQESWFYDRNLLAVVDARSSLGTILIWLSRGLEAVCESVDDLTFSLDSVYVDAAQRQVIELKLPHQAPMLLSDLLDWIVRAARDEGPRLIQDAGRDGVDAFAPVLRELRTLVQDSRRLIRTAAGGTLPDGMRTPRVHRAFQVLEAQLNEATRLARLVEEQPYAQAPQISSADVEPGHRSGEIRVVMTGINFRKPASAFLLPANREDIADVPARPTHVRNPSSATATFRIPRQWANVTWQVAIANDDGTQSDPVDITIKRKDLS